MARKSRKKSALAAAPAKKTRTWKTAAYARLSLEDGGRKDSDSIEIQAELIEQYIEQREYLELAGTYIDNGTTGTNFDRPDFNRMMADMRSGKIDCIVVKDLSRFGRNYIETCDLLEKILPFMHVRFISVNDGYDSETETSYSESLLVMLKNLVNDAYVKDISRKVISARKTQRERGEYTGAFAPYGYKKSDKEKGRLVPDAETAPVVRDIFRWCSEGMGKAAIANRLDESGIPCPSMRLRNKGAVQGDNYYKASIWQPKAVDRIVQSRVYLGHLVQGKTRQAYCEGRPLQSVPEADWCIVENTHEPLVSEELWEAANRVRDQRRKKYFAGKTDNTYPENVLKGLVVCAECGSKLLRVRNAARGYEYYYYHCPLMKQHTVETQYPMIPVQNIYEPALAAISSHINLAADASRILQKRGAADSKSRSAIDRDIAAIQRDLQSNTKKLGGLYENYVFGLLDEHQYIYTKKEYERKETALKQELAELSRKKTVLADALASDNRWTQAAQAFINPVELTRDMAVALIEHIEVRSLDEIEIVLKYRDEYAMLEAFAKEGMS